jgi:hypothetical protein
MISYEVIVTEIAKHITQAQSATSDAYIREELSAIRALCDVALQSEEAKLPSSPNFPKLTTKSVVNPLPQQTSGQVSQSLMVNKLQEDDANGDSIFDF